MEDLNGILNNLLIKVDKFFEKKENQKLLVILDSGHGGSDTGATGNGLIERDLNKKVCKYMEKLLKGYGIEVLKTVEFGKNKSLSNRGDYFSHRYDKYSSLGYDVVGISIHHNAGGGNYGMYIHTIFEKYSTGDELAKSMATFVEKYSPQGKVVTYSRKYPGKHEDYYALNRGSGHCPVVISEYAFVDNKKDAVLIDSDRDLKLEAAYQVAGIFNYFNLLKKLDEDKELERLFKEIKNNIREIEEKIEKFQKE